MPHSHGGAPFTLKPHTHTRSRHTRSRHTRSHSRHTSPHSCHTLTLTSHAHTHATHTHSRSCHTHTHTTLSRTRHTHTHAHDHATKAHAHAHEQSLICDSDVTLRSVIHGPGVQAQLHVGGPGHQARLGKLAHQLHVLRLGLLQGCRGVCVGGGGRWEGGSGALQLFTTAMPDVKMWVKAQAHTATAVDCFGLSKQCSLSTISHQVKHHQPSVISHKLAAISQ